MKKTIYLVLFSLFVILSFTGCAKGKSNKKVDVAFVTDMGTVMDGSYNQDTWQGIERYANEVGITADYFIPGKIDKDEYLTYIKNAVSSGAKVVVCQGELFGQALYEAQNKYPKVKFILVDGIPHNEDYSDMTINDNTLVISFKEEQAGFLAGYSAVRDGFTNIGFMGGAAQDGVVRYGYGFVQGADYAAIELGRMISISYCYGNTFDESQTIEEIVSNWYKDGCQVVFACGGEMGKSVMRAAENNLGYVIGVDSDQSDESDTVITSALKNTTDAVYLGVKQFYESEAGGKTIVMDASNGGIGLEMDNSKFKTFNNDLYQKMFEELATGKIVPYAETNIGNTFDLKLVNATVNYFEIQ